MNTPLALAGMGASAPVQPREDFQRRYLHSYHLGWVLTLPYRRLPNGLTVTMSTSPA
jgi:hypothetical protein